MIFEMALPTPLYLRIRVSYGYQLNQENFLKTFCGLSCPYTKYMHHDKIKNFRMFLLFGREFSERQGKIVSGHVIESHNKSANGTKYRTKSYAISEVS